MDIKPGKYRHFKGKEYRVLGMASHSETLEPMVVYQALYGEGRLWVRSAAMWNEIIDRDGYHGPRFIPCEEQPQSQCLSMAEGDTPNHE